MNALECAASACAVRNRSAIAEMLSWEPWISTASARLCGAGTRRVRVGVRG